MLPDQLVIGSISHRPGQVRYGLLAQPDSLIIQNAILLLINAIGVWHWLPKAEKEAKG